jgi:hypothetical protein
MEVRGLSTPIPRVVQLFCSVPGPYTVSTHIWKLRLRTGTIFIFLSAADSRRERRIMQSGLDASRTETDTRRSHGSGPWCFILMYVKLLPRGKQY